MTWDRNDWVLPAQYWSRRVQYEDFAVEYFFLESGFIDTNKGDPGHNMCQNGHGKSCYGITEDSCPGMFQDRWAKSQQMVKDGVKASTAEWHIIVTHFPGPDITPHFQNLGIDLVVTGHQHEQLTDVDSGIQYIITGGGGGVTSEEMPVASGQDNAYGFIDFTINRTHLKYDMYSWGGYSHENIIRKSVTLESHKYKASKKSSAKEITV